ncbi:MAG: dienelactone hydrolase family protein [Pseudomonas sp.]
MSRRNAWWQMMGVVAMALLSQSAAAAMQARPVEWKIGNDAFSGVLVYDDAARDKRPGLVMVPNWMGVTDVAVEKARKLAGDDYVILVADVYGKGRRPANAGEAGKLAGALKQDTATLRVRAQKAVEVLKAQAGKVPLDPARIGAVGFCFGGTTVLELLRSGVQLAGVVSLHGGLSTPTPAAPGVARTPLLVLNGAADKSISKQDVAAFQKEMDVAGADWQFVDFSGAVHCFAEADAGSDPASNCRYDARAAKRAYRMLGDFFEERFGD